MVLYKLEEFDTNYQNAFGSDDIKGYDVYADRDDEKVVLREEVRIRKEVEQETMNVEEQVRREELDVNSEGRPSVDKNR